MILAYKLMWMRFLEFDSRSSRWEYWWTALAQFLIAFFSSLAILMLGLRGTRIETILDGIYKLYLLVSGIPMAALCVRRLHDGGHRGWWYFIVLVPVVGWIIFLIFMALPGNVGRNEYGKDPLML